MDIDETDFICLATVPKSGTHYTRHFLVNYLRRLEGIDEPPLFGQALRNVYPNRRYDYRKGAEYKQPGPLPAGVRDFVGQHGFTGLDGFPGWVIALIRNPLDYIVSQYHYRHQSRRNEELHVGSITDVIDTYALKWARGYAGLRAIQGTDLKVFAATYEELVTDPQSVFERMIRFIGQPVDHSLIATTIADVQPDKFTQSVIEQMTDEPAFTVPIARSGKIGQWEKEMSKDDVARAARVLKARGIDLDQVMNGWAERGVAEPSADMPDPRDYWSQDTAFSDREIDFAKHPLFTAATSQLKALAAGGAYAKLVEVGSGSGRYLAYLHRQRLGLRMIGSDIPNPRLDRAQQEFPGLKFVPLDALQMAARHMAADTIILAMNVIGNLTSAEMNRFLGGFAPGAALLFCERGLPPDGPERCVERDSAIGFDHNYALLLREHGFDIRSQKLEPTPKMPGRIAYITTAVRRTT